MALHLKTELPTGLTGEYWRIVKLTYEIDSGSMSVLMGLYADEEARNSGKSPITLQSYSLSGVSLESVNSDGFSYIYGQLKTLEVKQTVLASSPVSVPFENAKDIL